MSAIYERLGVPTLINAKGAATRLSGGPMPAEVAEAMREAAAACVDMWTLQGVASERIAAATGAEAGMATSGAAAGLLLGTAACLTGLDPGRIARLPDTGGMPAEVVMVRSQRNFYDHAVRAAGARLVEVGLPDRYSGAGIRDAEPWEIAQAIGPQTACVFYVAAPQSRPALSAVADVAHAAGVPVLVDAAAQLPPAENLRRFIAEGADLVAFSGGKAIQGPQASGILAGKRDLIAAALLNMLDHDIDFALWQPPANLLDKRRLKGLPPHGIGRSAKVGKEQIVGLMVALERFQAVDPAAERRRWQGLLEEIVAGLPRQSPLASRIVADRGGVPMLELTLAETPGLGARDLVLGLQNGRPAIAVDTSRLEEAILRLNPTCLQAGEPAAIGRRLTKLLGA